MAGRAAKAERGRGWGGGRLDSGVSSGSGVRFEEESMADDLSRERKVKPNTLSN